MIIKVLKLGKIITVYSLTYITLVVKNLNYIIVLILIIKD